MYFLSIFLKNICLSVFFFSFSIQSHTLPPHMTTNSVRVKTTIASCSAESTLRRLWLMKATAHGYTWLLKILVSLKDIIISTHAYRTGKLVQKQVRVRQWLSTHLAFFVLTNYLFWDHDRVNKKCLVYSTGGKHKACRPNLALHLVLSGLAPCFYPAATLSSHLTVKE